MSAGAPASFMHRTITLIWIDSDLYTNHVKVIKWLSSSVCHASCQNDRLNLRLITLIEFLENKVA